MPHKTLGHIVGLLCTGTYLVQGKEFCFGVNNEQYRCEMGYCCGETHCCTYYYELWWFWLVWTLVIMLSCCCAYRHRRVKMRLQQEQRQREISLMAYQGASSSFVSPPPISLRFWTDCKLPDYEEVVGHPPTPPPPYSESPPEVLPVAHLVEPSSPGSPGGAGPVREQVASLPADDAMAGASGHSVQQEAELPEAPPSGEEMNTRRRHVTGDSGIEVCVCHIDAGDSSAPEEEEEDQERLCQGASGSCCAERLSTGQRKASYEVLAPDACSGGDALV